MLSGSRPSEAEAPKPRDRASEAISGMSWDRAVEAEEITSGERVRLGEACGSPRGSTSCNSRDSAEATEGT